MTRSAVASLSSFMQLSFQTFCLVFGVTILHLIAFTLIAPLTGSAGKYFADLDVEAILENGREDLKAAREQLAGNGTERAVTPGEGFAGALPGRDKVTENPDSGDRAVSEPARGAIADIRVLADRVSRPGLDNASSDSSDLPNESGRVDPVSGEKIPEPPKGSLVVREIRPL